MRDWIYCDGDGGDRGLVNRRTALAAGIGAAVWWMGSRTAFAQAALRPDRSDGPVMVVVFLRGGADGLNIVAPYEEENYYRLRPTLAIARPMDRGKPQGERLIDLDGFFGLNPSLAMLEAHFKEGRLGFVHACGSADATRSHFEAMGTMERGAESKPSQQLSGWIARHLNSTPDRRDPMRAVALSSVTPDSLLGNTSALTINNLEDYRLGIEGAHSIRALQALYAPGDDILSVAGRDTISVLDTLKRLDPRKYVPREGATYPDTAFGRSMKQVAFLVKGGFGLEVAALDLGGWDSHVAQGNTSGWLTNLLTELGGAVHAFLHDLGSEARRVSLVVQTEFGRTNEENSGFGTDHGRGGVMLLAGAGVEGGKVHGRWPGLTSVRRGGPGDLDVTTDYRSVLAGLVRNHLGNHNVGDVFPGARLAGSSAVKSG
ncbi:MAG: DUF1501 domain-containing protein [Fimbriimonadaceae bacterium]|nr:DUF1501 domain-containing protein [Fimbriimonadaceae bacterium]